MAHRPQVRTLLLRLVTLVREQTAAIVSLDSVVAAGGIITSCKTTDKMVYAHWEGGDKGVNVNVICFSYTCRG